jgi:DNA modification methylase
MAEAHGRDWALYNGNSARVLPMLPSRSVDFSIFSPPFSRTYTYSPSEEDFGNAADDAQFWEHFGFVTPELLRVMKPGRLVAVHVANLPAYENRDGASGRKDFRGDTIRYFQEAGFVYHSEIGIQKNPQAQAIRTHSKGLLFAQMCRDTAGLWQAWADYVVVFRAPGKNTEPVQRESTLEAQNEWVEMAHPFWRGSGGLPSGDEYGGGPTSPDAMEVGYPGTLRTPRADLRRLWREIRQTDMSFDEWWDAHADVWTGIRETDVLGVRDAKENDDERHLCPLQLPVIERCVRLWSGPGEVVLSPFAGIGSEGVGALRHRRKFVGAELKPAYFQVAKRNLVNAEAEAGAGTLFDDDEAGAAS